MSDAPPILHIGRAPLVGRARERAMLAEYLEEVRAGHPIVILLSGAPGIGKTRLLEEVASLEVAKGMIVLRGSASQAEGMPPYLRDVVAVYERALGHSIPVQTIAPGELLPNLPPVPGLAEVISGMAAALDMFDSPIDVSETADTFGVQLIPIDKLVTEEVARATQSVAS